MSNPGTPLSPGDVAALTRQLEATFLGRSIRRFISMEGIDRSLVLASQAFTALIPLLLLVSTLAPEDKEDLVARTIIKKFHLEGDSAEAVHSLFSVPPGATSSLSVISVLLLFFSGVSFTRRMQRMYRSGWGLEKVGVRSSLFAALGLVVLIVEAAMLYLVRALVRALPLDLVLMLPITIVTGTVLWTSIPYLLLDRRVHWRRLVVCGALAGLSTSIYGVATAVYMPGLVERYTTEFGLFGVTIAIIGWLLVVSVIIVASTAIGAEFDATGAAWAWHLKDRFRLYDPELGLPPPRADSPPGGDALGVGTFENPFMLRRMILSILIVAAAVWVGAAIVPGVTVDGGLFTYLWIALLFGLVNAVLGPILHLLALPITVLTLGLFALVVNGALLAITAWLSGSLLDVNGFVGTVLGALVISLVTAVLGLIFSPLKSRD